MANLVTTTRAKLNPKLRGCDDEILGQFCTAASAIINQRYTIPATVPAVVEEACVQLICFIAEDLAMRTERLGEYARELVSFPPLITLLLLPYKTAKPGPQVLETEAWESETST